MRAAPRRTVPGACVLAVPLVAVLAVSCTEIGADKRMARQRWDTARGAVKASLAAQQLTDGDVRAAEASIADARRLSPDLAALDLIAAKVEIAKGSFARARERLTGSGAATATAEGCYLLGVTYLAQADWTAALDWFQRAMALAPEDEEYLRAMVQTCLGAGYAAGAREIVEERAARTGWTPTLYAARAECAERQGRYSEAADDWLRAADDGALDAVRERAAYALLRAGRWVDAVPLLRGGPSGLDDDGGLAQRLALVDCLLAGGDVRGAEDVLDRLRAKHAADRGVQRRLAVLLARRGRLAQALDVLAPLTDDRSQDVAALELAAAIAHRAGDDSALRRLTGRLRDVCGDSVVLARLGAADGDSGR